MGGYPEIYKKGITKKVKGAKKGAKWEMLRSYVEKRAKKGGFGAKSSVLAGFWGVLGPFRVYI